MLRLLTNSQVDYLIFGLNSNSLIPYSLANGTITLEAVAHRRFEHMKNESMSGRQIVQPFAHSHIFAHFTRKQSHDASQRKAATIIFRFRFFVFRWNLRSYQLFRFMWNDIIELRFYFNRKSFMALIVRFRCV